LTDTSTPHTLCICMGSACHKLGTYRVLPKLQKLVADNGLEQRVTIKGAFCLGDCNEGIIAKVDDQTFTRLSEENVEQIFTEEMLPLLR
jgi:NADH:ubiquinone oxidoreductase subunit E